MTTGRISLLVDSPFREMLLALRAVPAEARKQVTTHMRANVEPIWFEEVRDRAATRLQQRTLVDSARVGVATRNVYLRSGAVGRLSSGTPVSKLAIAAEFGANPTKQDHPEVGARAEQDVQAHPRERVRRPTPRRQRGLPGRPRGDPTARIDRDPVLQPRDR